MAVFQIGQQGTANVLLHGLKLDVYVMIPAGFAILHTVVFCLHQQNVCNLQFIESFYLKYGIYKPREVKYHINLCLRTRFFIRFPPTLVYKSHILNRTINNLYIIIAYVLNFALPHVLVPLAG